MMVIKNPEQYGIEQGLMIGPDTYKYGVSMFHSLHCLVCTSPSPCSVSELWPYKYSPGVLVR
jgi:hypothetical protein